MTILRVFGLSLVLVAGAVFGLVSVPAAADDVCKRPSVPSLQGLQPGADRQAIEGVYAEVLAFQRASRKYRMCLKAEDGEQMERGTAALHYASRQREQRVATEFHERLRRVHEDQQPS